MKLLPLNGYKNKINIIPALLTLFWLLYYIYLVTFINLSNWKVVLSVGLVLDIMAPIGLIISYFAVTKSARWKIQKKINRFAVSFCYFMFIVVFIFLWSPLKTYNDLLNGPVSYSGPCTLRSSQTFTIPDLYIEIYENKGDGKQYKSIKIKEKDFYNIFTTENNLGHLLARGKCYRTIQLVYLPNLKVTLEVR